jgi:hypothetical protein
VVVPLFADQPANARATEAAGAGLAVFTHQADEIANAIRTVLASEFIHAGARKVAAELASMNSVNDAVHEMISCAVCAFRQRCRPNPGFQKPSLLARGNMKSIMEPAGPEAFGSVHRRICDPAFQRPVCSFSVFELYRSFRFRLQDGCALLHLSGGQDIGHLQANQITSPKFAVDCQVGHSCPSMRRSSAAARARKADVKLREIESKPESH